MTILRPAGALALALFVTACGSSQESTSENRVATAANGEQLPEGVYSGSGTIQSLGDGQVVIAHGPIPGIGWPAMTMTFTVPAGMEGALKPGGRVEFSFRKDGTAYVLTAVKPQ